MFVCIARRKLKGICIGMTGVYVHTVVISSCMTCMAIIQKKKNTQSLRGRPRVQFLSYITYDGEK